MKIPWTRKQKPEISISARCECLILIMPDFPRAEAHDGNKSIPSCSVAMDIQLWKSLTWWLVDMYIFTVLVPPPPPLLFLAVPRLNGRATFRTRHRQAYWPCCRALYGLSFTQERWSDSPFKSIPRYIFQILLLVSDSARIVW